MGPNRAHLVGLGLSKEKLRHLSLLRWNKAGTLELPGHILCRHIDADTATEPPTLPVSCTIYNLDPDPTPEPKLLCLDPRKRIRHPLLRLRLIEYLHLSGSPPSRRSLSLAVAEHATTLLSLPEHAPSLARPAPPRLNARRVPLAPRFCAWPSQLRLPFLSTAGKEFPPPRLVAHDSASASSPLMCAAVALPVVFKISIIGQNENDWIWR